MDHMDDTDWRDTSRLADEIREVLVKHGVAVSRQLVRDLVEVGYAYADDQVDQALRE